MTDFDEFLEIADDFASELEQSIARFKQRITQSATKEDFNELLWNEKQGEKGPFQQTSGMANNDSELWKQLQTQLKQHNGFWQHNGYRYWFDMNNEALIDRRKIS